MAEYLIQDTTLEGLADSVRTITGETKELSPAEIKEQLIIAEEQVSAQADLIAQISSVLDDKIGGKGVETCIVKFPLIAQNAITYTINYLNKDFIWTQKSQPLEIEVIKNTIIFLEILLLYQIMELRLLERIIRIMIQHFAQ